ncbi:hypothetical protein ACFL6U_23515 [Planctomycetota bacterium]
MYRQALFLCIVAVLAASEGVHGTQVRETFDTGLDRLMFWIEAGKLGARLW